MSIIISKVLQSYAGILFTPFILDNKQLLCKIKGFAAFFYEKNNRPHSLLVVVFGLYSRDPVCFVLAR